MFIDKDNNLYFGDMVPGDRAATSQEIAAFEAARVNALKVAELNKFRSDRKEMFAVIAGMGWAASATADTVTQTKLLTFREGLKDLPEWPAVASATTHAELKAAMAARYKTLTDALPAAIKADFKKLYSS